MPTFRGLSAEPNLQNDAEHYSDKRIYRSAEIKSQREHNESFRGHFGRKMLFVPIMGHFDTAPGIGLVISKRPPYLFKLPPRPT